MTKNYRRNKPPRRRKLVSATMNDADLLRAQRIDLLQELMDLIRYNDPNEEKFWATLKRLSKLGVPKNSGVVAPGVRVAAQNDPDDQPGDHPEEIEVVWEGLPEPPK